MAIVTITGGSMVAEATLSLSEFGMRREAEDERSCPKSDKHWIPSSPYRHLDDGHLPQFFTEKSNF
jgi:hypothetical protein